MATRPQTCHPPFGLPVVLLLVVAWSSWAEGQDTVPARPAPPVLMQEFARTFEDLERAHLAGNSHKFGTAAATLARAATVEGLWRAEADKVRAAALDTHLRHLKTTASGAAALAQEGPAGAGAALEDIRRSCTGCHVRFRGVSDTVYPARQNTVTGQVDVRRVGGVARADRSGVTVFLEGGPDPTPAPSGPSASRVSQRNGRFFPRVLPLLRGSTVHFPNDDVVFHNVFSRSLPRPFDLGLYNSGQQRSVEFPKTGLVKVYCNIHPGMVLNVLVLNNGFFDVTDDEGRFVITSVPDGTYVLRTWHERGGDGEQRISVSGGKVRQAALTIVETRKSVEHLDKYGQPYKRKY
jgi:plastocyanin/cytochrome c556